MTENNISAQAAAARENARQATGQFGAQVHTDPEAPLGHPTLPEGVTYGIYEDGTLVSAGEKGAGMTDALNRARLRANSTRPANGEARPALTIRAEGSDVEVPVPYVGDGRIVGWHMGDAVAAEELDARGLSLTDLESVSLEPFIDLGAFGEGEIPRVEKWIREGDFQISHVYAHRDEETGERHVDVATYENFLWNAESQCPDSDYEDDSDLDPDDDRPAAAQRYDAWLDENEDIVKEVYLEWFNADIDVPGTWAEANVTLRTTVPYERFTESLVMEDVWPLLTKHANCTDPGTFGSPYVMGEVRRRVEARETAREAAADKLPHEGR